jgi:hypothetical protein
METFTCSRLPLYLGLSVFAMRKRRKEALDIELDTDRRLLSVGYPEISHLDQPLGLAGVSSLLL